MRNKKSFFYHFWNKKLSDTNKKVEFLEPIDGLLMI